MEKIESVIKCQLCGDPLYMHMQILHIGRQRVCRCCYDEYHKERKRAKRFKNYYKGDSL